MTGDAVRLDGPSSYSPWVQGPPWRPLFLVPNVVLPSMSVNRTVTVLVGNHDSMGPAAGTAVGACSGNLVHRDLIGDAAQQCLLRHRRQPGGGK